MVYNFQKASEYIVDVAFKFPVAGIAVRAYSVHVLCVQYTDLYMRASHLAQLASQPSP